MPRLADIKYDPSPQLLKFVGPEVPPASKMMAARGMLPLPPRDLMQVLFFLAHQSDAEVKKAAVSSAAKMPEAILKSVLEDKATHPRLLDFFARILESNSPLQDSIALNPSAHDETIVFQAALLRRELVEIISNNQARILRCPDIVDALAENTFTGQAALDRILKFVEMETIKSARKAGPAPTPPPPKPEEMEVEEERLDDEEEKTGEQEVPAVTETPQDEIGAVTEGEQSPWARMTFDEELLSEAEIDDVDEIDEKDTNVGRRISKMKTSQKIKLAMTGGSSARAILIKDSNKIVSSSVLKSPRITDKEIETISKSRSVSDEVIRIISMNRDWTKSYQIKMNLVQHPKCPAPDAMRFMNFLRDKDLRDLSKSRNVPSNIAQQAKRLLQRKEEKAKPGGGKH